MPSIDPRTHIGAVHLRISSLERSVDFYRRHVGLTLNRRDAHAAWLGAGGPDLLVLTAGAFAPKPRGTTGLYHFAILVPSRLELALSLHRFVREGTVMQGSADHGVSEALYLSDPDGNGIEVYRDRPRDEWPRVGGQLHMVVDPLNVDAVLAEVDDPHPSQAMQAGTTIGHVHLHVADLRDAKTFYVDVLGFDVMQRFGPGALFVSAGGYHHHLGLNTWMGVGAPPPPDRAIGLDHFVVELPDAAALEATAARVAQAGLPADSVDGGFVVRDPSGNRLRLSQSAAK